MIGRLWLYPITVGALAVSVVLFSCAPLPGPMQVTAGGLLAQPSPLASVVASAEIVVVGRVVEKAETYNSCAVVRDGKTYEDSRVYCLAQRYLVSVERYLKGKGEPTLKVGMSEGIDLKMSDGPITEERIAEARQAVRSDLHVPMQIGHRYLLMLSQRSLIPSGKSEPVNHYAFSVAQGRPAWPWRYVLSDSGDVYPEDGGSKYLVHFPDIFPHLPSDAFIAYVERVLVEGTPTPASASPTPQRTPTPTASAAPRTVTSATMALSPANVALQVGQSVDVQVSAHYLSSGSARQY